MYRAGAPVTACPRCQRALEERDVSGEQILACVACGGIWLDPGQTALVFKRFRTGDLFIRASEDAAALSQEHRPATDGVAICPVGGEEMTLCEAEGVRIDQCKDHGTWFDARELGRIVVAADEPSMLEVAVETGLARTKQWLSRALWGGQKLPR